LKLRSVNLFVLNWNGRDLTLDCLSSLEKITYPNVKVYVIDNGSSDNSVTAIRNQFPEKSVFNSIYEIIELPENYGFARGNNAGFELVKQKANYTIFLNNDTIVDPNFVEPLINAMESNSTVKQSTPKIFYADNLDYIWFGGGKVVYGQGGSVILVSAKKIHCSFRLIGMLIMRLVVVFVCAHWILNR